MSNREQSITDEYSIDRRQFLRLSAAASGTLLVPGAASAQEDITSEKFSETYEFVVNHTPTSESVETLVRLDGLSGVFQLRELDVELRTTRDPELAAYLEPTPEQVRDVVEVGAVQEVLFSPGANPFWRLENYDDRVFTAPRESTGLISFEEMVQGMQHLAEQHSDRLSMESIGESAGRYNLITHDIEPNDIWLFELTNDVNDDESFAEKEKLLVFNQDSSERQGPEGMFRFAEDVLRGDEPEVEPLLDEMAFVFVVNNPDGWVSKQTQYYSGERVTEDEIVRVNEYKTLLPTGADPNRSYPTPGYITPEHYPAEPAGSDLEDDAPGVDDDVPDYITEHVPGELDIAEYFRTRDYQNLEYGVDLHGFGASDTFLESFPLNGNYDYEDMQDLYALQRSIDTALDESRLGSLIEDEELRGVFERLNEEIATEYDEEDADLPVPENTFKYGTLFDILGYSTTGDTISWMSGAEENGGLGTIKTFATETVYSIDEFIPSLVESWVVANATVIRATAKYVVKDVEAGVQTDGASTAYVTADELVRSSEDLSFDGDGGQTTYDTTSATVELDPGSRERLEVDVSAAGRELVVNAVGGGSLEIEVVAPEGDVVQTRRFRTTGGFGATRPTVTATARTAGTWRVNVENVGAQARSIDVTVGVLQSDEGNPDPREVLGFSQRDYEVSPFAFFREYQEFVTDDGGMTALTARDVRDGALTSDGGPAFDNVVLIHANGMESQSYVSALDEYVASGGNLVLTDTGVHLLGAMDNELAGQLSDEDLRDHTLFTSFVSDRNDDHPLLAGTEPSQLEVGKWVPLGYSLGLDCPMTLVDPEAFREAGGSVAATTSGKYQEIEPGPGVSAGTLTRSDSEGGIHVLGGALPPATQDHLHPFGMSDYLLSHLGMMMVSNALGYETNVSVSE
ncbi:M14 family metallopeptidase [Halorussus ruber]|uniref:M14 family metallopeptidase n=1 Tax=Halorussus ruber TaxID=1126238 RepID=UPI0010919CA4|nr:M14 family metallopeptidase [Halorussus ruber]